jgi:hypothetical protein
MYLENLGGGRFASEPTAFARGLERFSALVAADLDLDQDSDLCAIVWSGRSRVFSNLERQVAWRHAAELGASYTLDLWGPPAAPFVLLGSYGRAFEPLGPLGTLLVDRQRLYRIERGQFDVDGEATVQRIVPNDAALFGLVLYDQILIRAPRKLSNLELTRIGK